MPDYAAPIRSRNYGYRRMPDIAPVPTPVGAGRSIPAPTMAASIPMNPYNRLKTTIGQTIAGRLRGASQAVQGRLDQQGISDIPGVQASVAGRMQGDAAEQIAQTNAQIDQQGRQEGIRIRENADQLEMQKKQLAFAKEQFAFAKSQAERAYWSDIIGGIVGGAVDIGAAVLTGGASIPASVARRSITNTIPKKTGGYDPNYGGFNWGG